MADKITVDQQISQLTLQVEHLLQDVEELTKTVLTGNGEPSLVKQTTVLYGKLKGLEATINDKFHFMNREIALKFDNLTSSINIQVSTITDMIDRHFQQQQTDRAGKWELRTSLVTSAIAVIIAVVAFILNKI
tara:strand:+ start:643 stop:1041 length:399 start_codon:yes stop_codon:yes gene_type:complete